MPALTWKSSAGPMCLFRCSQPHLGLKKARSENDELLLSILGASSCTDSNAVKNLLVIDCRPATSAAANVARNGGWELSDNYPNVTVKFADIENIHQVRESLQKMRGHWLLINQTSENLMQTLLDGAETTTNDEIRPSVNVRETRYTTFASPTPIVRTASTSLVMNLAPSYPVAETDLSVYAASACDYYQQLARTPKMMKLLDFMKRKEESSKWFQHLSTIIAAANIGVESICHAETSVLVHCSDG